RRFRYGKVVECGQRGEVEPVRCPKQQLERFGHYFCLREEREDTAPVVVEHDERGVDSPTCGSEQAVGIVQQSEITEERDARAVGDGRDAEDGRKQADDTVRPAVRD